MTNTLPAGAAGEITMGDRAVRRMGYGAMRITGWGIWGWPKDRENAKAVLRRAVELGVNFIDTADAYGPDVSETLIGEALHPYPADVVIATKAGLVRSGPNRWSPDGRPDHIREACEGSLARLKVEALDVYQLHRPDSKVPLEDSLGAMVDLQRQGKVRLIGICNVNVKQLAQARAVTSIVSVQNRYNPDDRESDPVLEVCEEQGMAFLPWRPVGGGGGVGERVDTVARARGATAAQVALAWLLARSPVILPIPGTSTISHLEENIAAASVRLTDEELRAIAG